MSKNYLVWSNEHEAWWGPGFNGYVQRIADAGRYSREEALRICTDAMPGRLGGEPLHEIPVRVIDIEFMMDRFAERYPGHDPEPKR